MLENEIEVKIMLRPENIAPLVTWIERFHCLEQGQDQLANGYYDTEDRFFERHKMGLRVRTKNNRHELTLKTEGNIVGGLHIRPEYSVALTNNQPDWAALVRHYHLPFSSKISALRPIFSTDFERQHWLIAFQQSQIEIALDQGWIKTAFDKAIICEVEFELKQGNLADLFDLLALMPAYSGVWLSSLSKAERGYLLDNSAHFAKKIEALTACQHKKETRTEKYAVEQQLVDLIRLTGEPHLITLYNQFNPEQAVKSSEYFYSAEYLTQTLARLRSLVLSNEKGA